MNRFYSTNLLLCLLLSLNACTKDVYSKTEPFKGEHLEVMVEVPRNDKEHTTENVSITVDVVNINEQKTLYESWEQYAPRKAYDETNSKKSYSDPAITNAIKPVKKKVSPPKVVVKPVTKPKEPVIEKIEEKKEIDVDKILNSHNETIHGTNNNSANNGTTSSPSPLEPEVKDIQELTQEQLDAAKALLPQDFVPPPPATNREPLILRGNDL